MAVLAEPVILDEFLPHLRLSLAAYVFDGDDVPPHLEGEVDEHSADNLHQHPISGLMTS